MLIPELKILKHHMKKIILFRISSRGYPKLKVEGIDKYDSLNNLTSVFKEWEIICVADNCGEELLENLRTKYQFSELHITNLGNPGSFWRLYEIGLSKANDEDCLYFIEDDYLHTPNAPEVLLEGIKLFDYVTLYDHPDKYRTCDMPLNPYAKMNRYSELTEVVEGHLSLWRTTNSTTMSFALTGKTLKEDRDIWSMTEYVSRDVDFDIFCTLTKQKTLLKKRFLKQLPFKFKFRKKPRRFLGVSIPGNSLHLEQAYLRSQDVSRFLKI
jgi:glycosyltransferase involved in cell wall biosynthesis